MVRFRKGYEKDYRSRIGSEPRSVLQAYLLASDDSLHGHEEVAEVASDVWRRMTEGQRASRRRKDIKAFDDAVALRAAQIEQEG